MDIINSYFKSLIFSQVEEKQGYTIYGASIAGSLGGGTVRYILLFVPSHLAVKKKAKIYDLPWKNLQTRELQYSYRLPKQAWNPERELPDPVFNIVKRDKKSSQYSQVEGYFPFEVLLLHNPKKKTVYQYRNKITLSAILRTFSSVFNYVGEVAPMHYIPPPSSLPPMVTPVSSYTLPNYFNRDDNYSETSISTPVSFDDSFEYVG